MKKFVALIAKEKQPIMNGKITMTFFQPYISYIKIRTILFPYFTC